MNHPRILKIQCDSGPRRSRLSRIACNTTIPSISSVAAALLVAFCGSVAANAQDVEIPDGLTCPEEIAGGERISVALAAPTPGVLGYCIYYLLGETDLESVTMTLRTADSDYDWEAAFKAPKMEKGGMRLVEEATRKVNFGEVERDATIVVLTNTEEDLGQITESFSVLWVFNLDDGRIVSLEEEYNNVSEGMREPLRDALLAAQGGGG